MEAISNAGSCVGVLATDGVVLAAEKKITSKVRVGVWLVALCFTLLPTQTPAATASSPCTPPLDPQLLDTTAVGVKREKLYQLDDHVACAVAGITADANILVNTCRLHAQRYTLQFQEPIPVDQLVRALCDTKQGYTQYGGLRPFGVSLLYAGWDEHRGFQLYQSDPSGNYGGWKATSIGANHQAATNVLQGDYAEDVDLERVRVGWWLSC